MEHMLTIDDRMVFPLVVLFLLLESILSRINYFIQLLFHYIAIIALSYVVFVAVSTFKDFTVIFICFVRILPALATLGFTVATTFAMCQNA